MKKLIISALIVAMSLSLVACGSNNNNTSSTEKQTTQDEKSSLGNLKTMPQFKVNDINDNVVNNDIFKDKKITLINIWGTFCKPCIDEMPYLQELYKEYKEKGVNILGVVSDASNNEVKASEIIKESKVEFINLIPNEKFDKEFVSKTTVVPVSVFVNNNGDILEIIFGSKSKDDYKKIIENVLQKVK